MGSSVLKDERDSALLLANRKYFTYDYKYKKISNDEKDVNLCLSFINTSNYLYKNSLYKVID